VFFCFFTFAAKSGIWKTLPDVEMAELLSGENEGRNPLNAKNGGCPVDEFLTVVVDKFD